MISKTSPLFALASKKTKVASSHREKCYKENYGEAEALGYFLLSVLSVIGYFQLSNTLIEMRSSNSSRATFLDLNTCTNFRIRYRVSEVNLRLQELVNKMAIFVTFVDGWMPLTNATDSFILDVAMVLDTSLWSNYQN